MKYCAAELQNDLKIRTIANVRKNGHLLKDAPEEMKGDRELCMAAVAQDWKALEWAGEEMKGDRELCMAAVAQDGRALNFVSKELKAALVAEDTEIRTLATWLENPMPLKDAPEEMKRNRPICMAAVAESYWSFEYVSMTLKSDEDFVLAVLNKTHGDHKESILGFASAEIKRNERVRRAAGM